MNWKVGDIAIVQNAIICSHFNGMECEIIAIAPDKRLWNESYEAGILVGGQEKSCMFYNLKPLPDGNEKGSWEDCVFKPKELICN